MRLSLGWTLLVLGVCSTFPAAAVDSVETAIGTFDALPSGPQGDWTLRTETFGDQENSYLELSGALSLHVRLPALPEKDDIAAENWYAVVSVDYVASRVVLPPDSTAEAKSAKASLSLSLPREAGKGMPARAQVTVLNRVEVDDSASDESNGAKSPSMFAKSRLWLRVPCEDLSRAGDWLDLELAVSGAGAIAIDNLRVERFHRQPTRSLLGKANGKNGPDLLGAGMFGFTGLTEHLCTSFSILDVRDGGPADRAGLLAGDLIVAVEGRPLSLNDLRPGWSWFESSNEAVLGRAIQSALEERRYQVTIDVLRDQKLKRLKLKLPVKGKLDDGFPFSGKLGEQLRDDLLAWTTTHQRDNGGWPGTDAVNPAMGGLALLGTREKRHAPAIRKCVDFLLAKNPRPSEMKGLAYWTVAYQGIFFAEYYMASGDERVLDWMVQATSWLPGTTHECKWGMQSFGHGPDGLPYDEKSLMAPTAHLLVFDALARKCGVESRIWEHVREYVAHSWSDPEQGGHGGMGYNASYKDKGEFWSRSGLTALAACLRGESGAMRQGLCLFMGERHPWMLISHAYGEPGAALGLLSLATAHRPAYDEVLPQWRWRFLNAWEPGYGLRYSTPHMGAPYMGQESIVNLSYAMLCSVQNGGLVMAGGEPVKWMK